MDVKDTNPSISGGTTRNISVVKVMIVKRIPYMGRCMCCYYGTIRKCKM